MRWYALAERPFVSDGAGGGWWGSIPGVLGAVDLAPVGSQSPVFVTSDAPFTVGGNILVAFGDGTRLDQYALSGKERNDWNNALGVSEPNGTLLLEALWNVLTIHADPNGITGPKPIMPTHKGVLELRLGGHSLIRAETLPDDPTTHPAWPNIQRVLQNDYRQNWTHEGSTTARKWLGNEQSRFKLTPERARDLIIPADLPQELPLRPTTTVGDTFTDPNLTELSDHTATGPNGGHTWEEVTPGVDTSRIIDNFLRYRTGAAARTASDGALSSADHYVQAVSVSASGFTWGGIAARFSASANTAYFATYIADENDVTLHRIVAGSATEIARFERTYAQNDVLKIVCDGSTISVEVNATEVISETDTNITGNLRTGFNEFSGAGSNRDFDDWEASDLGAAGQTVVIGQAVETDAGLAAAGAKAKALGLAAETDSALALSTGITVAIGLASETDAGLAASVAKTRALGLASEADTGLAVTTNKSRALALASEVDVGLAAAASKSRALALAAETDTGLAAAWSKAKAVGLATETDAALAVTAQVGTAIGIAIETDTGLGLTAAKAAAIGLASETATGLAATALRTHAIALASETDVGQAVAAAKTAGAGIATEADTGFDLAAAKALAVGLSQETDSAFAVIVRTGTPLSTALETSTAFSVAWSKAMAIGLAGATDTSLPATARRTLALATASEIDVAQAFGRAKARAMGIAAETDTALPAVAAGGEIAGAVPARLPAGARRIDVAAARRMTGGGPAARMR